MKYVLETKFKSENSSPKSFHSAIDFNTLQVPDETYPALIFINAEGVKFKRNKVSFNGNFLGYLSARSPITILEVDNRVVGKLTKCNNQLDFVACDNWGNTNPTDQSTLDEFKIVAVQVAYSSKGAQMDVHMGDGINHDIRMTRLESM